MTGTDRAQQRARHTAWVTHAELDHQRMFIGPVLPRSTYRDIVFLHRAGE